MPKGPQGQRRPADAIGCAVMVGKIATGEVEDECLKRHPAKRGSQGGIARASRMSDEQRIEIAKAGAAARWR